MKKLLIITLVTAVGMGSSLQALKVGTKAQQKAALKGGKAAVREAVSSKPAKEPSRYPVSDAFGRWLTSLVGFETKFRQDFGTVEKMFNDPGWEKRETEHAAYMMDAFMVTLPKLNKEIQDYVNSNKNS